MWIPPSKTNWEIYRLEKQCFVWIDSALNIVCFASLPDKPIIHLLEIHSDLKVLLYQLLTQREQFSFFNSERSYKFSKRDHYKLSLRSFLIIILSFFF